MDEKYVKAFNAVVGFVEDLWDVYGVPEPRRHMPLALYRRLIQHITFTDAEPINKCLVGFKQFLSENEKALLESNLALVPRGTRIYYGKSKSAYLDIQKYIYQADEETEEAIRQHLLTISTILEPNKEKMAELERRVGEMDIDTSTREGEFLSNIMNKAKDSMATVDADNPMQAISGLLSSGVLGDLMTGITQGMGSGEMDIRTLMGTMQTAMGALMPAAPSAEPPRMQDITDESSSSSSSSSSSPSSTGGSLE